MGNDRNIHYSIADKANMDRKEKREKNKRLEFSKEDA